MRMLNGSNIPLEVWDHIFMHCEYVVEPATCFPKLYPSYDLRSLLLVCREWYAIAEKRLYTSVALGSDIAHIVYDKKRKGYEEIVDFAGKIPSQRFYRTVRSNHRLASLVRELHLGSARIHFEQTELHIQLLKICENVEILELHGCAFGLAEELKTTLASTNLVSFRHSTQALSAYLDGASLFTMSQLLAFIQVWPRLETLDVDIGDHGDRPTDKLAVSAPCTSLRNVTINGHHIKPTNLAYLSKVAPFLEKLTMTADLVCAEVLQRCLTSWSSTLKNLCVRKGYYMPRKSHIPAPVFNSPMVELRSLEISKALASPQSLAHLSKLDSLIYNGGYADVLELAQVIEDDKIPSLRELDVVFDIPMGKNATPAPSRSSKVDPPDEMYAKVLLELHRVCGPRHIAMTRISFWTVEELEDFITRCNSTSPRALANDDLEQELPLDSESSGDLGGEDGQESESD